MTSTAQQNAPRLSLGTITVADTVTCRVCGRGMLAGERSTGMFDAAGHGPWDVCELCVVRAGQLGLVSEPEQADAASRRELRISRALRRLRRRVVDAPATQHVPPVGSAAIPIALRAFNRSHHVATLASLRRSLGEPETSVQPSGTDVPEVMVTVVWDVGWYQYRISPDGIRWRNGSRSSDIGSRWRSANAAMRDDGAIHLAQPLGVSVLGPDRKASE